MDSFGTSYVPLTTQSQKDTSPNTNQVHTIEYVAYHPQLDIYLEWPWSDYQCPGFEGRAWWYWLNSTIVKPHTLAPDGCPRRTYSGSPNDHPNRFVDWILNTRADIVKETGLPVRCSAYFWTYCQKKGGGIQQKQANLLVLNGLMSPFHSSLLRS